MNDLDKLHKIVDIRNEEGNFKYMLEIGCGFVEIIHNDSEQVVVTVESEDTFDAISLAIRSFELKGYFEKDYEPFRDTM